jgi:uncharacterized protein involved in type VI secretion and phage assembly
MTVTGGQRLAPHTQTQVDVKIAGQQLGAEAAADLLEVRIDLGVRTIGRATLVFQDRRADLLGKKLELGTEVEISSVQPPMVIFTGTVTGVELDAGLTGTTVTATLQDRGYQLSRNRDVTTYQRQSYADVLQTVARSAGLQVDPPASARSQHEWLLQADSHLGLVDEIAGRLGHDWAISGRKLAVWPVSQTAPWGTQERTLELGVELLTFSVRRSDLGATQFTVRGWDPMTKAGVTATSTSKTERDGFAPPQGDLAKVLAAHQVSTSSEEAKQVAAGLAAAAGRVSGRGRAGFVPELRPGGVVSIRGVGEANGRYYVREVSHQVDAGSLRTSFHVGDRAPVQLSDPWEAPAPFSSLRHTGLTVGVVDNLQDPEALGRVRVQLVGLSTSVSSHWARVLSLGGGNGHGLVLMPEIDDEVLVAFEEDDVRRPVVIGGLFGKKVKPAGPSSVSGREVVSRHLVSRKGHRLELADGPAASNEHVQLVLADGKHLLRIGKDSSELKAEQTPLTISAGGASITFDGRGNITIDAHTLTLKAKQALKLEGMEVAAKATTTFEASGLRSVLSGSAQAVVKSGGVVEVTGMPVKIN